MWAEEVVDQLADTLMAVAHGISDTIEGAVEAACDTILGDNMLSSAVAGAINNLLL